MQKKMYVEKIVEFKRKKIDKHRLRGFVLDYSEELTIINVLTDDYFLNGYTVIRNKDITKHDVYCNPEYFLCRALKLKGMVPDPLPSVDLTNWQTLLTTANSLFSLITIRREKVSPNTCNIGKISRFGKKHFHLYEIDTVALWDQEEKYRFKDLTKVDFGGGYEDALWRVAFDDNQIPFLPSLVNKT